MIALLPFLRTWKMCNASYNQHLPLEWEKATTWGGGRYSLYWPTWGGVPFPGFRYIKGRDLTS